MEKETAIFVSLLFHLIFLSTLSFPQSAFLRGHSDPAAFCGALSGEAVAMQDTIIRVRGQESQDRGTKKPGEHARPDWMWRRPSAALPFIQPRAEFELTYDVLDSLSRLHPELKKALLGQAIVAGALRDDSVYRAWHDNYLKAISGLGLPGELESEMRQNQRKFGTTYDPMRGPLAPHQVDVIKLML